MLRPQPITREEAETLALRALAHIASEPTAIERLLALTGLSPTELKASAAEPATLAGVLDYLLGNEAELLAFCAAAQIEPSLPARARRLLPGSMSA